MKNWKDVFRTYLGLWRHEHRVEDLDDPRNATFVNYREPPEGWEWEPQESWNMTADLVVNETLRAAGLPTMEFDSVEPYKGWKAQEIYDDLRGREDNPDRPRDLEAETQGQASDS